MFVPLILEVSRILKAETVINITINQLNAPKVYNLWLIDIHFEVIKAMGNHESKILCTLT